jgi:two-component system, LuxR family, sensor kinase FixL
MAIVHASAAFGAALDYWRQWRRKAAVSSMTAFDGDQRHVSDASFHGTLERMPLAMFIVGLDGRIDYANACAEMLFGYARHQMRGMLAEHIVPGACTHDDTTTVFACRKDQTRFLVDVTSSKLDTRMLAVVIDRTERDELRRNRQELAHLTRVSMLGELAASLAHELNQPLTAILSNAQAAQRFMNNEPIDLNEVREILCDLVADNNRASEILRRIRALVKKGELESMPLSIASVISDVALLVHSDAIQRGIRVVLDIDPHLPMVRGDKVQLQQVVLNLLLNAFDAMDVPSEDRTVHVLAVRDGEDRLCVSVRDAGHGVPAELADQLFKPFCTSKREGLGLGLSISRTIVEMHGGRIWAQNNADRGATFRFTLPVEVERE